MYNYMRKIPTEYTTNRILAFDRIISNSGEKNLSKGSIKILYSSWFIFSTIYWPFIKIFSERSKKFTRYGIFLHTSPKTLLSVVKTIEKIQK